MKQLSVLLLLLISGNIWSQNSDSGIKSSVPRVEEKIDSVLNLMTLEEKVGQLIQYNLSWDLTGPKSESNNNYKEEMLKKGMVD